MDDLSQAVVLMLVGAILGAVITPSTEILFKSRFMKSRSNNNFADGLILLCSANGLWIICILLMVIAESEKKSADGLGMILLLVFTTLIYIWSFSKFKKAALNSAHREIRILLRFLVLGNLFWVLHDLVDAGANWMKPDICLTARYLFLVISASLYFGALVWNGLGRSHRPGSDAGKGTPSQTKPN